jgi:hypothetical protein
LFLLANIPPASVKIKGIAISSKNVLQFQKIFLSLQRQTRNHNREMVFPNVLKGWGFMSDSEASVCASDLKQTPAESGLIGK